MVEFTIDDIVPYLQWAKDIPCHGEVTVQMYAVPRLYAQRNVDWEGNFKQNTEIPLTGEELRLKDGEFVKTSVPK